MMNTVKNRSGAMVWIAVAVVLTIAVTLAAFLWFGRDTDNASLDIKIHYDASLEVPPEAYLTVVLMDMTELEANLNEPDFVPVPIAERVITEIKPVMELTLSYDPDRIIQDNIYAVGAGLYAQSGDSTIDDDSNIVHAFSAILSGEGFPILVTDSPKRVITQGNPNAVEIRLVPLNQAGFIEANARNSRRRSDIASLRMLWHQLVAFDDSLPADSDALAALIGERQDPLLFYVDESGQTRVVDQIYEPRVGKLIIYRDTDPTSNDPYPDPDTVHIYRGYACSDSQLAGGGTENSPTSVYSLGDLAPADRKTLALVYQLEDEDLASCETQ